MYEVLYILLIITFGSLIVASLVTFMVRGGAFKDELQRLQESQDHKEKRLRALQEELEIATLDIEILEQDKSSLDSQEACLRKLEQFTTLVEGGHS
jgi:TolA-binding protein